MCAKCKQICNYVECCVLTPHTVQAADGYRSPLLYFVVQPEANISLSGHAYFNADCSSWSHLGCLLVGALASLLTALLLLFCCRVLLSKLRQHTACTRIFAISGIIAMQRSLQMHTAEVSFLLTSARLDAEGDGPCCLAQGCSE